jgi:hypothetical protein
MQAPSGSLPLIVGDPNTDGRGSIGTHGRGVIDGDITP